MLLDITASTPKDKSDNLTDGTNPSSTLNYSDNQISSPRKEKQREFTGGEEATRIRRENRWSNRERRRRAGRQGYRPYRQRRTAEERGMGVVPAMRPATEG
ncbi:hypothetical protein Nepgr_021831 [Nepenthes gracilis]|uniref:Uncharacterized protein n=1 Tax=Nepenthes gracilis TaxID=150966 RepID=A0AAD3SZD9_NEPGR|nr:hypothetical protein Nepgr_021831 [Nepenthes gracilis]